MPNYEITMDVEDSGSGTIVDPTQLNDAGNAKRAEAWAVGQRNGVDVPSTDPTYHNNSKYYAQQAGSSAGSASSSADAAAAAAQHYPYVDSTSGNWMVWDTSTSAFVDTGVHAQGPTGPTGPGVPSGGTAGQVLKKVNGTDYNTEWANNDGTTIPMSSTDATTLNAAITSQNQAISNLDDKICTKLATNVTSSNIDSITATGTYQGWFETSIVPTAGWGTLVVTNTENTITQTIICESTQKFRRYIRGTSSWAAWQEFALNSDVEKYDPSSANALSDCNSATETGRYKTVNNTSNTPIAGHFVLDVIRYNNAEISQVARLSYSTRVFVRGTGDNGSTWTSWQELALKSDLINAVNLSTNLTIDYADAGTIGYRTTETTKVDIQNLQGFPTGKTIICAYPRGYDDIYGATLWVDNSLRLRGTSKTSRTISVTITVFYK